MALVLTGWLGIRVLQIHSNFAYIVHKALQRNNIQRIEAKKEDTKVTFTVDDSKLLEYSFIKEL
jgi:transcription antitermination factor NusA-like protein